MLRFGASLTRRGAPALLAVLAVVWLLSGVYTVSSGEEAVVQFFGRQARTVRVGGLKWHLPWPFETVRKENVSEVRRLELGFRTVKAGSKSENAQYQTVYEEAKMLTADEAIVLADLTIQYRVTNIEDYLFQVDDQLGTFRIAAESAVRRVIASHTLDEALTDNKATIQSEIKTDLQAICDKYRFGLTISAVQLQDVMPPEQVDAAFKAVAAAKEEKMAKINEAQAYANEVLPKARGQAAADINGAEGYKQDRINRAKGDVALFTQLLDKYRLAPTVTRTRLYLETLDEVLPKVQGVYIVNDQGDTVKFLPLMTPSGVTSGQGGK